MLANNFVSTSVLGINKDTLFPTVITFSQTWPSLSSQNTWYRLTPDYLSSLDFDVSDNGKSGLSEIALWVTNDSSPARRFTIASPNAALKVVANWTIPWDYFYDGLSGLTILASDLAANTITVSSVLTVKKDTTSPLYLKDGFSFVESTWYNVEPMALRSVTISYSDSMSGLKSIAYEIVTYDVNSLTMTSSIQVSKDIVGIMTYNVPWSVSWDPLYSGVVDIWSDVMDVVGNRLHSKIFTIRKDVIPPNLIINSSPDVSQWYRAKPYWFQDIDVDFHDEGGSNLKEIWIVVSNNGQTISSNKLFSFELNVPDYTNNFDLDWVFLQNGTNDIQVSMNDGAGNSILKSIFVVKKDETPPSFNLQGASLSQNWLIAPPTWISTMLLVVTDDGYSGINLVQYGLSQNGGIYDWITITSSVNQPLFQQTISFDWVQILDGQNEIILSVNDNAKNSWSHLVSIINKDSSIPRFISTVDPIIDYNRSQQLLGAIIINDRIIDDSTGTSIQNVWFRISQDSVIGPTISVFNAQDATYDVRLCFGLSWNVVPTGFSDLILFATDLAGNNSSVKLSRIIRDTTPPQFVNSENGLKFDTWYNQPNQPAWLSSINVWFSDPGAITQNSKLNNISYIISNNGTLSTENFIVQQVGVVTYNTYWPIDWSILSEGVNDIVISLNDIAYNHPSNSVLFSIKKDITSPNYVNKATGDTSIFTKWYGINSVHEFLNTIDVQFFDKGFSGLASINYGVYSNSTLNWYVISNPLRGNPTMNTPWAISWSVLTNGINDIYVSFNDVASNNQQSPILFSVWKDVIPPSYNSKEDPLSVTFSKWYSSDPQFAFDVDFFDRGGSRLKDVYYIISNDIVVTQGIVTTNINKIATFNLNWNVSWNLLQEGLNSISVSLNDFALNQTTSNILFIIKKDISPPSFNTHVTPNFVFKCYQMSASTNVGPIDVDFSDTGGSGISTVSYGVSSNGVAIKWYSISVNKVNNDLISEDWYISYNVLLNATSDI